MQTRILIDSIMRQTTVLIAQICVSAGVRAPLAHLADEVFLQLSRELENQGLSRKVVADMFGIALRSYQRRVQRIRESSTDGGTTLWQAVLRHVSEHGPVSRHDLFTRFHRDDPAAIGAVLNDLQSTGLVTKNASASGPPLFVVERGAVDAEAERQGSLETPLALLWLEISRNPGTTEAELTARLGFESSVVETCVGKLETTGEVSREAGGTLFAVPMMIPVGAEIGWEAALFDHFQSMCAAIVTKLARGSLRSRTTDTTGGATLTFEIYDGHPMEARVLGLLSEVRHLVNEVWEETTKHTEAHPVPPERIRRVAFYFGQAVRTEEEQE